MRPVTCPDCAVTSDRRGYLAHDDTCPLGMAGDQQMADDRLWFTLHPHETERRRRPHWSEVAQLRLFGAIPDIPGTVEGDVVVTRLAAGVRAKRFDGLWLAVAPEPEVRR